MVYQTYRTEGVLDTTLAKTKRLAFVGAGSLGSEELMQFAYHWGQMIIIDPDVLKINNIERHRLGKSYLGKPKAPSMKHYLTAEFGLPAASILAYVDVAENVLPKIGKIDLVLSSIDNPQANNEIGVWCRENNVPAVYGGIYPKGSALEVITIPAGLPICYRCAELTRSEGAAKTQEEGHDYGINPELVNPSANQPVAVPALRKSVTAAAADMAFEAWRLIFPQAGDKATATILYHALEDWTDIFLVRQGSQEARAITNCIAAEHALDTADKTIRLGSPDNGGYYPVQIRRRYWPRKVEQHPRCGSHGKVSRVNDY